jgi:hypothetical protein
MLWKILGATNEEIRGDWEVLYNKELYFLYSSPDTFRAISTKRIRWARYCTWQALERREI